MVSPLLSRFHALAAFCDCRCHNAGLCADPKVFRARRMYMIIVPGCAVAFADIAMRLNKTIVERQGLHDGWVLLAAFLELLERDCDMQFTNLAGNGGKEGVSEMI